MTWYIGERGCVVHLSSTNIAKESSFLRPESCASDSTGQMIWRKGTRSWTMRTREPTETINSARNNRNNKSSKGEKKKHQLPIEREDDGRVRTIQYS